MKTIKSVWLIALAVLILVLLAGKSESQMSKIKRTQIADTTIIPWNCQDTIRNFFSGPNRNVLNDTTVKYSNSSFGVQPYKLTIDAFTATALDSLKQRLIDSADVSRTTIALSAGALSESLDFSATVREGLFGATGAGNQWVRWTTNAIYSDTADIATVAVAATFADYAATAGTTEATSLADNAISSYDDFASGIKTSYLPTSDEKAALATLEGYAPSASNKIVTEDYFDSKRDSSGYYVLYQNTNKAAASDDAAAAVPDSFLTTNTSGTGVVKLQGAFLRQPGCDSMYVYCQLRVQTAGTKGLVWIHCSTDSGYSVDVTSENWTDTYARIKLNSFGSKIRALSTWKVSNKTVSADDSVFMRYPVVILK